ncbi:MAG: hypothetical protein K9G70_12820 [Prolixibacteraceae bacterium]|nr:hypothetical protein [Prolixibacteraceae bacterium]
MIRNTKNITSIILVALLTLSFSSCNDLFNNPLKDKETGEDITLILVDPNVFDTRLSIHITDYVSGEYIDNTGILFSFSGDDAQYVVDAGGTHRSFLKTNSGKAEVFIDPNVEISKENPIELTLFSDATDEDLFAYPVEVTYTRDGHYDIILPMFPSTTESTENAPFELLIDNNTVNEYDPNWDVINKNVQQNGKTYYSIYRGNQPQAATVTTTTPEASLSNWGFEGYHVSTNEEQFVFDLTQQAVNIPENTLQFKAFLSSESTNYTECKNGFNINISETNGLNGTGNFNYEILAGNTVIKKGKIGAIEMPQTVNTGAIFYPHDANNYTLNIYGDNQYNLSPEAQNINNICEQTFNLKATPKENLEAYKIVISFYCKNSPIGIAPSATGEFNLKTDEQNSSTFSFNEGVATLQLLPDEIYSINASIVGTEMEFDFPTNQDKIKQVIEEAAYNKDEIEYIDYTFEEGENGMNTIKVKAYFHGGKCPF